jgi:cell division septation protein DedD
MKKKIFVSKDSRSGFRSYLKFLLWAAVGLVVLVLFIPLTSRQKSGKESLKKPASERGVVVKEIPKNLQPIAESITRGQGGGAEEGPKGADSKTPVAPDGKGPPGVTPTPSQASIKEKPLVDPPPVAQKAETSADSARKSIPGRPGSTEPAAGEAAKEVPTAPKVSEPLVKETAAPPLKKPEPPASPAPEIKPKAVASAPAPSGKPVKPPAGAAAPAAPVSDPHPQAPSNGHKGYVVQIATLKDKQSAEELKNTLQKKGFDVVMKTTGDPKQGQTYSLTLQPVDTMSKASTLMEQVKYVPKVKPAILPVPTGN